ncbi:TPA: AMP-binding protein [Salmonella enterica subsp. enterica serovar Saintpaul]
MSVTLTFDAARRKTYRESGYWGDASLGDYWRQTARAVPDKIAVVDNHGASWTYAALDCAASRLANWLLSQGIQPGDRVAFQLPGWCEFTLIYLACLKTGAVSVPLLPAWREAELVWVLNKCQAKIFFAPTVFKQNRPVDLILPLQNQLRHLTHIVGVDKLAPATTALALSQIIDRSEPLQSDINIHGDELAAVLFTSGTEGMPKGVMLTHNNILASERAYCARLNLTWQDVFLMPAPLGHATGFLHGVTAPFLIGARSVLLDIFTPEACLTLLAQQRCTCMSGATPFIYDLLCAVEQQPADLSSLRFFLCGGTTIPKKVARDCQQRGIKITGRKKDIIIRGGENISSREVEDILLQHPRIHDACVVAMPDERLGERSCAYVVLKPPHLSLTLEEVIAFFSRKRVAKYKYPERIVIVEKLPRTASGKVQKFLLRQDIIERLRQEHTAV